MIRETIVKTDFGEVRIEIQNDGYIAINGLNSFTEMGIPAPLAIWKTYKNYRLGDKVIRSGHGLCGVYDFDPNKPLQDDYVENDTMHSTTAEEIAQNIFRFYPGLFDLRDQMRIITFLRYHDLGETKNGDKPDDGSSKREEKVETELAEFVVQIQHLPPYVQEQLIRDFIVFENAGYLLWEKEDKTLMQFAKLCDKTDAPLSALLFETQGRSGTLSYKKEYFGGITDQDAGYIKSIHEDSQAAVWTAHMLDTYRDYENLDIFASIIVAAVRDVRGEVFPGLRDFLETRGIFDETTITRLLD